MNHEIKTKRKALTPQGVLRERGYSKRFNFIYNREDVKWFPARLKEWDFYQFEKDHWVVQLTLGHLTYIGQANINLINIDTGEKYSIGIIEPLVQPRLGRNPEEPHVSEFHRDGFHMTYRITDTTRILDFKGYNREFTDVAVHLELENDIHNDKIAIATPFEKPTQFYLNFKENYYTTTGFVRFDKIEVNFDHATGVLDWGRGVWPYSHHWYWGSLSAMVDNAPLGFNIGWGFGNLSHATENIYYYKKKGYKIGKLHTEWDNNDVMKSQHIYDKDHKLDFVFTPYYNHETANRYVVLDTHCDQVFGHCTGFMETDEGRIQFSNVLCFIEHAANRW